MHKVDNEEIIEASKRVNSLKERLAMIRKRRSAKIRMFVDILKWVFKGSKGSEHETDFGTLVSNNPFDVIPVTMRRDGECTRETYAEACWSLSREVKGVSGKILYRNISRSSQSDWDWIMELLDGFADGLISGAREKKLASIVTQEEDLKTKLRHYGVDV